MEKMSRTHLIVLASMCGLSMATVGLITNVAGIFFTPMAEDFGILRGSASLTLTIANVCVALGGLFTRRLVKKLSMRALLVFCTIVLSASTWAMSCSPSIGLAYVLSAVRGLAGGVIGFVLITYVLNKWFEERLGLVTSIAMSCSGVAGAVFAPLIQAAIEQSGWRAGMMLTAVLHLVLCLPAILCVRSTDPVELGLEPYGSTRDVDLASDSPAGQQAVPIHKLAFVAVMGYAVLSAAVSAMPQHFVGFADSVGLTAATGAAMVSACMLSNTVGKVLMGWLCDKIGALKTILGFTVLVMASIGVLLRPSLPILCIAAAFVFGLCYARATVGLTMTCREVFGSRGFGLVYPKAALATSISNAVFSSAIGYAYDITGGYVVSLVTLLSFLACSAALSAMVMRPQTAKRPHSTTSTPHFRANQA
ncbi:MAG: MFS transporter [Coriobacteriales bacterium]|nr:MFS transporter [Coriobacteriales bacterium]